MMFAVCSISFADNTAANKSREGIEAFQKRDFQAALKSFTEAENAAPDDLRLAFDRGCAFAAESNWEKAVEQFQKSAASPDKKLSARSNYNLGCVKILEARAKFGEMPEEATEDIRKEGLEMLAAADYHFRDALAVDSQDENARYNLEALRAWSRYIRKAWRDRDRQLRREKTDLFEYLRMLEADQRDLMSKVKELQNVPGDSPRKRQSIREAENAERELLEEIGSLKEKIERLGAGQGGKTALPADGQKAVAVLKNIADEIGRSMESAADRLAKPSLAESIEPQQRAVENLDQIFSAVAPYVPLVQKGIERQEKLLEEKTEGQGGESDDAAWNQRFIERYGKIIPLKARQELKQLESQPAAPEPLQKTDDAQKEPDKEVQDDAAAKSERQRQEMKEALQAGVELSPKVEHLAREAAKLLLQEKSADALPKQQEALKLLKEMLPKEQQQEQQKKDQEKKDQQKKDQEKKDQDKKDQQKKDQKDEKKDQKQQNKEQDKKDQKKKDEEKKEDQKKNQEKKDDQKKDEKKKDTEKNSPKKDEKQPPSGEASPQKKEMSKEQAEASLRRAKQRQIEYRELQEELREKLYRPEKVEKDW